MAHPAITEPASAEPGAARRRSAARWLLGATPPSAEDPAAGRYLILSMLLLLGSALTLLLHWLGAPEALFRWLYRALLSGLDVPRHPSRAATELVSYTSLVGGLVQLAAAVALCLVSLRGHLASARSARGGARRSSGELG